MADLFDLQAKISLDSSEYEKGLQNSEKKTETYRSAVMKLAQEYKNSGMTMSEAMKQAYSEIDKSQYETERVSQQTAASVEENWSEADVSEGLEAGFESVDRSQKETEETAEDAAKNTASHWENAGEKIGSALKKAAEIGGKVLAGAAATATAAIGAAAVGITDLTKSAVSGFADYEQLVGGVETLFGNSADQVKQYAEMAYQTAGLSANEYMETVTGFSASLLQSLGGDTTAAAEYADMAITDMSDNANKMGTSMESIQNAYSGFAKGNFTMLDNLKLGYGGTASEMQRLIEDAEKLDSTFVAARDENGELAMSYADIVDAIHIVQTDMGIAGTTAKEASTTISGSLGSLKSAWDNLISGLGREDADIGQLLENVFGSADTVLDNLLPVIDTVLENIGTVLEKAIPKLTEVLPGLIEKVVPIIVQNLPIIINGIMQLLDAIMQQLPVLIPILIPAIVQMTVDIIGMLIQYLPEILMSLWDALVATLDSLGILDWFEGIWESIKGVFEAVGQWFSDIFQQASDGIKAAWDAVVEFFTGIWDGIKNAFAAVGSWFSSSFQSAKDGVENAWSGVSSFFSNTWSGIKDAFSSVGSWFSNTFQEAKDGVLSVWDNIKEKFGEIWDKITGVFSDAWNAFTDIGRNIIEGLWEGIQNAWNWVSEKVSGIFDGIVSGAKKVLGIASPSKVFAEIGENTALGYGEGFSEAMESVSKDMLRTLNATVDDLKDSGIDWEQYGELAWMSNGGIEGLYDEMRYNFEEIQTSAEDLADYLHSEYELSMSDANKAVETLYNKTAENIADLLEEEERISTTTRSSTRTSGNGYRGLFGVDNAGGTVTNTVTINVYPSEGMDENEIADLVERKLMTALDRREAAWA